MKKFTKLLLAGALMLSAGSAATIAIASYVNEDATAVQATNPVIEMLYVGGRAFSNVNRDIRSSDFDPSDNSWDFYASGNKLVLNNYKGSKIVMSFDEDSRVDPYVDVRGNCTIDVPSEDSGILFVNNGNGHIYGNIEFVDEGASLIISGGNYGIRTSCTNTSLYSSILISGANDVVEPNRLIINDANNGVSTYGLTLDANVDVYINAKNTGAVVSMDSTRWDSSGEHNYRLSYIAVPYSSSSLTIVAGNKAFPYNPGHVRNYVINECGCIAAKFDDAMVYMSSDDKVYHIANEDRYLEGFLQYTDLEGQVKGPVYGNLKMELGDSKQFGFNNLALPSQLAGAGYSVERTIDYKKKGATESIYNTTNEATTNLSYIAAPSDLDTYTYKETLKLKKGGNAYAIKTGTLTIYPETTHFVTEDIRGFSMFPAKENEGGIVRTGKNFKFTVTLDANYFADHVTLYADSEAIGEINGTWADHTTTVFTIENVRKDLEIYTDKPLSYKTNYRVYASTNLIDQGTINSGNYYTLPTLTGGNADNFTYWQVGNRTTHYPAGYQITFNEDEVGDVRIEAHFTGVYCLTIEDGHFYSDSACTQEIAYAQQDATVYFKFNSELDAIVDGKMLYSYIAQRRDSGPQPQIYDMDGYWQMYVPASDVLIKPVYKYVINEVTAENVVIPVAGEPFIEGSIDAPSDANYVIASSSILCYKRIDSSTRTLVNTYDPNNPYIFENDATYEFEFQFRIPSGSNYLLHPDGYLRDSGRQITIDGLNEDDFEVVSADFTNSYKEYYKVVLRMTAVNQYAVNVTSGTASINGKTISLAPSGATVLLSANIAPTGKAFDKWEVTGVSVDEASLTGSKLSFEMPNNAVSATATYKDVSYFAVTFNANGGTGTIADDISYGDYILPMCTFTAPEHKHFKAWDVNGTEYVELANITVAANIEVKAIWVLDEHTISFNANGGSGTMAPVTKDYGSSYTLPANGFTSPAHKHFAGWALSATGSVITTSSIEITGDVELFAIWATDTHTITFACTSGATGSMDPVVKEYNDTYVLPTPTFVANDGKEFKYWTIDGVKVTESSITITGDVTLTAVYGDITVDPVVLDSITLSGTYPTTFEVGDTFSYEGLVVTAHYSDLTSAAVTGFTVSSPDMSTAGTKTITVSYTEGGVTKTATYQITVSEKELPPVDPETPKQPSKGLPAGAIVGIVAGSVLVAGIGGFALVWFVIKKKTWADFVALFKKK